MARRDACVLHEGGGVTRVLATWKAFRAWLLARHHEGVAGCVTFLQRRDTALTEFWLSLFCWINAWQVTTINNEGQSAAPFLDSAIDFLILPKLFWVVLLVLMGGVKLLVLTHGLIHNNFYLIRARVSFGASVVWSLISLSIITGENEPVTAARYLLSWFMSILVFLVLGIKHRHYTKLKSEATAALSATARNQMKATDRTRLTIDDDAKRETSCGA
jgi:hypothetical protein